MAGGSAALPLAEGRHLKTSCRQTHALPVPELVLSLPALTMPDAISNSPPSPRASSEASRIGDAFSI